MAHRLGRKPFVLEELTVLQLGITIASSFVGVAKILVYVFIVLAVLSFFVGGVRSGRLSG